MAPTPFQKKLLWAAITAVCFVGLGAVATLLGWIVTRAIWYLQPLLIPVAIAGILAYLLEPAVEWLEDRRLSRTMSVIAVFSISIAIVAGILIYIIPAVGNQAQQLATHMPEYTLRAQALLNETIANAKRLSELPIFQRPENPDAQPDIVRGYITSAIDEGVAWLQKRLPDMVLAAGQFLQRSVGGFFRGFRILPQPYPCSHLSVFSSLRRDTPFPRTGATIFPCAHRHSKVKSCHF